MGNPGSDLAYRDAAIARGGRKMPDWLVGTAKFLVSAMAGLFIYHMGGWMGVRHANRWWESWTGVTASELKQRTFDRELRDFRRHIGRPADHWPEPGRGD